MSDLTPYSHKLPHGATGNGNGGRGTGFPTEVLEEQPVDLREVLGVLRRHALLVLGVTAMVVGITTLLVLRQVPQYRAEAVLRLQDERRAMTGGLAQVAVDGAIGNTADPILSQLQVLKSRALAAEVVDRTGLRIESLSPGFSASTLEDVQVAEPATVDTLELRFREEDVVVRGTRGSVSARYGEPVRLSGVQFVVPAQPEGISSADLAVLRQEKAIGRFSSGLRASVRDKTDVIDVGYTDPDPVLAKRVVNETVDAFRGVSARTAQQKARRRRIFLEEQLVQTDSALALTQLALTDFQRREGVASSREKLAAQQVGLMELDVRREELNADRRVLRSLLGGLHSTGEPGSRLGALISHPGIAQNPAVRGLFEQVVNLEASRDSLTTGEWGRAESNPDVQRLTMMIGSTRNRLVAAVRSHAEALDARIAALDDLKARNLVELQALPASGAEEVRLVQRVEGIGKVADQLRSEYQLAMIAEAVEAGQVEVVDLAVVPSEPIGSGRGLKLMLGLTLGLLMGAGGAFLREHLNTAIHRKEDLEGLHLSSLAIIPSFAVRTPGARRFAMRLQRANGNGASPGGHELVAAQDLRSSSSEAYRTLRTNLIFSQSIQSLRTLVVTSSVPSEGKTTTAANLAVTFAQQGMRVLVVDCDLRKARLHTVFNVPREPGLTQLLLGYDTRENVVRDTTVPGLQVITAGTLPPNPAELLGGERMRDTLAALSQDYDLVLLDTPPLLAAADASVLGRLTDGVVIVVRAGHTERGAAEQALQQLRAVGAHVVGAVLNDPDNTVASHGNHYQYDYYGAESETEKELA
jgi:capsular exopolysaccharide synthesis family protein